MLMADSHCFFIGYSESIPCGGADFLHQNVSRSRRRMMMRMMLVETSSTSHSDSPIPGVKLSETQMTETLNTMYVVFFNCLCWVLVYYHSCRNIS